VIKYLVRSPKRISNQLCKDESMLSLGYFLTWIAITLIAIGLVFLGLNMQNAWVYLGAGMITITCIGMIISGIFTYHPNDA
jgi:hypothetical protein